jgi:hypothetical protein
MVDLERFLSTALPALIVMSLLVLRPVLANNSTTPGEIISRYPTVTCLAVEWLIDGDDDLDCRVDVDYRPVGSEQWSRAMPLVRVPAGNTGYRSRPTYDWPNKLSGSIFDLRPDTEYEIRLSLKDPDGGKAVETVKERTRPVPAEAPDSRVIEVNPRNFHEKVILPRFRDGARRTSGQADRDPRRQLPPVDR